MKRLMILLLAAVLAGGAAFSQASQAKQAQLPDYNQILKRLELTEEEIEWFKGFQEEIELQKREAQLELNLVKARLEKLLFPIDVDMKEVEKLMRTSIEWRLQMELAEIRWRVEVRRKLGDEKYQRLLRLVQTWRLSQNRDAAER